MSKQFFKTESILVLESLCSASNSYFNVKCATSDDINISGTTTLRSTATVTAVLIDDATRTVAFVANDTTDTDTLNMQLVGAGTVNWKAKITYNQINL